MAINKNNYLDGNGNYDLKKSLVDELIDEVNTHTADLVTDVDGAHGLIVKEALEGTDFSLANGWVGYVTPIIFTKIGNRVFGTGGFNSGVVTKGTLITTLPVGFRPTSTVFLPVMQMENPPITRFMRINTDGTVTVDNNYDWVTGVYYLNSNHLV